MDKIEEFFKAHASAISTLGNVMTSILHSLPLDPAHKASLQTAVTSAGDAVKDAAQAVTQASAGEVLPAIESAGTAVVEGAEAVEQGAATIVTISPADVVEAVKDEVIGHVPQIVEAVIGRLTAH